MSDSSGQHSFDDFASDDGSDNTGGTDAETTNTTDNDNVDAETSSDTSTADSRSSTNNAETDENTGDVTVDELPDIDRESFNSYWFRRNAERNIEENHEERNDPGHSWPIGRFEPHQLGNCKRKWFYQWLNAPKEEQDPHGIFAIGHFIEEDIVEPWLHEIFEPKYDIDNAIHVSIDIDTIPITGEDAPTLADAGTSPTTVEIPDDIGYNQPNDTPPETETDDVCLTVAGSTDPAICDTDTGDVIALTEVKSTGSIGYVDEPKRMHKMQLHAYMNALGITDGYVIYVDRDNLLDPKVFEVEFDEDVWQTVVDWVSETLPYAMEGKLPPADAPEGWMCKYCEYANRCGEGRSNLSSDMAASGFVPGFTDYPRNMVEDHLEAYPDVALSPSLALEFPDLAAEHDVADWICPECTAEFDYQDDHFDGFSNRNFATPSCPACKSVFDEEVFLRTRDSIHDR